MATMLPPPSTPDEVLARVRYLRDRFSPYLRSLPEPLAVRKQRILDGNWLWKFEVEDFIGGPRPLAPDWHRVDLDVSDWQPTTVPEWRYDKSEPFGTTPDPRAHRPDSRIAWYRTTFKSAPPSAGQRHFLVFGGVAYEAEVWLNGTFLGSHTAYWDPFRFDVTELLSETNVLAVRVLAGQALGEPVSGWTVFSCAAAVEPRHVRDAKRSVVGRRELFGLKSSCFGSGFGIFLDVGLETTADTVITRLLVRGNPETGTTAVRVETDSANDRRVTLDIRILPENAEGKSYSLTVACSLQRGPQTHTFTVPTPDARRWQPDDPCLYRCRVVVRDGDRPLDAQDALFGYRTFRLVTEKDAARQLPEGLFLLNSNPVYLRGAAVSPVLNTLWYWKQDDTLIDTVLMARAAGFNSLRACEHILLPEVREVLDRLGMLSEQDVVGYGYGQVPVSLGGAGNGSVDVATMTELCTRFARSCYNNPGVVLMTTGGIETGFDPRSLVEAVLGTDPDRILKPISGNMRGGWDTAYLCPPPDYSSLLKQQWDYVVNDFHCYNGWYSETAPFSKLADPYPAGRILTCGEFGAEGLDGYGTMMRYPERLRPPLAESDRLWGNSQVKRGDPRLVMGLRGREPRCLADFIEASQTYQADALAEQVTGFRLSPRRIGGHFVFHLRDGLPAEWQKSIVSFDGVPKKAYYALARTLQPVVPLFRFIDEGGQLELWTANDRLESFPGCRLGWSLEVQGRSLLQGELTADVKALDATLIHTFTLPVFIRDTPTVTVALTLTDADGKSLANYRREVYLKAWRPPDYPMGDPPRVNVPKIASAPDGDPERIDWNQAAPLANWRRVNGPPTSRRIAARIVHDGRFVYVRLSESGAGTDLPEEEVIWAGEDWELFFAASRSGPYHQIGIGPKGHWLAVTSDGALPPCQPRIVSRTEGTDWTVLIAFPLSSLFGNTPTSGAVCFANFFRVACSGDRVREKLAWSPTFGFSFHVPNKFGKLILG